MGKAVQFIFDDRSKVDREMLLRQGLQELTIGDFTVWVPKEAKLCNCLQNSPVNRDGHWTSCPSHKEVNHKHST